MYYIVYIYKLTYINSLEKGTSTLITGFQHEKRKNCNYFVLF